MRLVYLILKFVLKFGLWVFYPRLRIVNRPKKRFTRTIYASNHAASFMDPLVIASNQSPIVFFMTRSDVFTPLMKPILWAAHMLPIYRMQDGVDTKEKNEEVFAKCNRILSFGRSLLIFSEGFTDDEFVRRLKPIKKGAVRMGFGALEHMGWKKKVYIQALGVNYSDPNRLGSEVVISNGDPICLNDYRSEYEQNPSKVIGDLTKRVELEMQDQITDVRDLEWTSFHEHIMRLTKKGMSAVDSDKGIPLLRRWEYSRNLAKWMNERDLMAQDDLVKLKASLEHYFEQLDRQNIREADLTDLTNDDFHPIKDVLFFIIAFPLFVLGLLHHYLPYVWVKSFVEKSFKRPVFWGSVKMLLGLLVIGIYNIILITAINVFVYPAFWFWFVYFFLVPTLSGVLAYHYVRRLKRYSRLNQLRSEDLTSFYEERQRCQEAIRQLIPVA